MCVCDETGICPPGCRYRPGGAQAWHGHDAATRYDVTAEPTRQEQAQADLEQADRQERTQ